jgi:AbrB family looped-hinge helix DNA binding protein
MKMATTVTVKGQVTLPKAVRDAVGIKPGDRVEVKATAGGTVVIEKAAGTQSYIDRLYAIARERPLRGISTNELMMLSRGDPDEDPPVGR